MKTRSKILRNAFNLFLLAVLALCICTPAFAVSDTTTLTTTVPSHFDMSVTIDGNGTLEINGNTLFQTSVILVERHHDVTCKITSDVGYHISSVIYNGNDITADAKNGIFHLSPLDSDMTFHIAFAANTTTPSTGDSTYSSLIFHSITAIASFLGIAVLLTVNRKKSSNK